MNEKRNERIEFEKRYISLYLKWLDAEGTAKRSLKGTLKQMDVQRYFGDYTKRNRGYDLEWNGHTYEVKTGYRFALKRGANWVSTDYIIWTYSDQIGSITDWKVYNTEEFIEACKPYLQVTYEHDPDNKVVKIQDHCENTLGIVLNALPFRYLDSLIGGE